ncbi:hypothetical protein AtubIFM54640_011649 [Aspergillus tubingensis]|nr:hypothetical protein AtubIFM54640_011649 [Aspergillus tubingensis]
MTTYAASAPRTAPNQAMSQAQRQDHPSQLDKVNHARSLYDPYHPEPAGDLSDPYTESGSDSEGGAADAPSPSSQADRATAQQEPSRAQEDSMDVDTEELVPQQAQAGAQGVGFADGPTHGTQEEDAAREVMARVTRSRAQLTSTTLNAFDLTQPSDNTNSNTDADDEWAPVSSGTRSSSFRGRRVLRTANTAAGVPQDALEGIPANQRAPPDARRTGRY